MAEIPEGHGLIVGRGRDIAAAALAAAEAAGVDPSAVRTTAEGYLVPVAVLKKYEDSLRKAVPHDAPVDEKPPVKKSTAKKS